MRVSTNSTRQQAPEELGSKTGSAPLEEQEQGRRERSCRGNTGTQPMRGTIYALITKIKNIHNISGFFSYHRFNLANVRPALPSETCLHRDSPGPPALPLVMLTKGFPGMESGGTAAKLLTRSVLPAPAPRGFNWSPSSSPPKPRPEGGSNIS